MKNSIIELYRFCGAIVIVFHHGFIFGERLYFDTGWIFVEFFFLLTGYFTAKHFNNMDNIEVENIPQVAVKYSLRKIYRTTLYAWIGIFIGFVALLVKPSSGDINIVTLIASIPVNLLFLGGTDLGSGLYNFNSPLWFISNILIFLPIIIVYMYKMKNLYIYIFSWIIPLALYSYNLEHIGMSITWDVSHMLYFRSIADLMLGTFLFYVVKWVQKANIKVMRNISLLPVSLVIFIIYILGSIFIDMKGTTISFSLILFTFLVLLITLLVDDKIPKQVDKVFTELGSLSLPIYCMHFPIMQLVQFSGIITDYVFKGVISIIIAIGITYILRYVKLV
ncbi:acyltransferase family protein [Veillonella agrestimuris]|uniref:acyltransferase family protein n=1 Tax=Veillonella agrestimuris TaxID=2941340 RepID=UPI002042310A|nr:acyltransferase family protein [Veillonella agrestimuris]